METVEKKIKIDGVETTFVLRKPTMEDEIVASEKANIPVTEPGRPSRVTQAMQARFISFRLARCIVQPEAYQDAGKLIKLPSDDFNTLMMAFQDVAEPSPNSVAPSSEVSSPGN